MAPIIDSLIKNIETMEKSETKIIKGKITEFTKNKHGVSIKKCCASCKYHEQFDAEGPRRKCILSKKVVDKSDYCLDWHISEQIDDVKLHP